MDAPYLARRPVPVPLRRTRLLRTALALILIATISDQPWVAAAPPDGRTNESRAAVVLAGGQQWANEPSAQTLASSARAANRGEQFYFVLPDRFANGDPGNDTGGLAGDRLSTGYDPTDKGFYHGGDLAGRDRASSTTSQGLGTTAIWLAPIFKNRPVQGTGARRLGRLPRLLDHRLHPGRPALRHQRGPEAAGRRSRTGAASRSTSTSSSTTPPT